MTHKPTVTFATAVVSLAALSIPSMALLVVLDEVYKRNPQLRGIRD